MTKVGLYAIGKSTTLESNKSLWWALIMAPATPFCFCPTQKHLMPKRAMSSTA